MERAPDASASNTPPRLPEVAKAFAACIRDALQRGDEVDVPALGTFRVEHTPSQMREQGDGNVSLTPPRNDVAFDSATG